MMKRIGGLAAAIVLFSTACATAPKGAQEKQNLISSADNTLQTMITRDPSLAPVLQRSFGYVVFPQIAKGGVLVGGAFGRGVVYQQGVPVGFAELNQASLGAQLGGQTLAELLIFQTPQALQQLKSGRFSLGGSASAVALQAGAAGSVRFTNGVAVFVMPHGGLMAEVSVTGQRIDYQPKG